MDQTLKIKIALAFLIFFYSGFLTHISIIYFSLEHASFFFLYLYLGIIFLPIIFAIGRPRQIKTLVNVSATLAFTVIIIPHIMESNIWPLAIVAWVVITLPVIIILNILRRIIETLQGCTQQDLEQEEDALLLAMSLAEAKNINKQQNL